MPVFRQLQNKFECLPHAILNQFLFCFLYLDELFDQSFGHRQLAQSWEPFQKAQAKLHFWETGKLDQIIDHFSE
jgi:hypothetical protein